MEGKKAARPADEKFILTPLKYKLNVVSDKAKSVSHLYSATHRSCSGAFSHRQSGCTAYRPQAKRAPTDVGLRPNSYTQPYTAV